jgi:hypothetical protein
MYNHKTTPTQLCAQDLSVCSQVISAITVSLRKQGITNREVRKAMIETRKDNKLYSELRNFYTEISLIGDEQVVVLGAVVGGDEFLNSFTIKNFASLEDVKAFAMCRLDALESVLADNGVAYA